MKRIRTRSTLLAMLLAALVVGGLASTATADTINVVGGKGTATSVCEFNAQTNTFTFTTTNTSAITRPRRRPPSPRSGTTCRPRAMPASPG